MALGPLAGGNRQDAFRPGREHDVASRVLVPGDGKTKTPDGLSRMLSLMPQSDGEPGPPRKAKRGSRNENGLALDPVLVTGAGGVAVVQRSVAVGPAGGGYAVQRAANPGENGIDLGLGVAEYYRRGGAGHGQGLRRRLEFGQQEIALGIPARTAVGQAGIGQGFQADGRDPLDPGLSHDHVRFPSRVRSRCQQGTILLEGQFRAPKGESR